MNKIFVGNLSFDIDEKALEELFSPYGKIEETKIITDRFSGKSKGFGFITFTDEESAEKAIKEMHNKEIEGRALKVDEAKPLIKSQKEVKNAS